MRGRRLQWPSSVLCLLPYAYALCLPRITPVTAAHSNEGLQWPPSVLCLLPYAYALCLVPKPLYLRNMRQ
jgi:hypothetical protein